MYVIVFGDFYIFSNPYIYAIQNTLINIRAILSLTIIIFGELSEIFPMFKKKTLTNVVD